MIRKLLATTALASVIATGAFAQDTTTTAPAAAPAADAAAPAMTPAAGTTASAGSYLQRAEADQWLATQLDGLNLYQSAAADAASAGEIDDLLVGKDGKIAAFVVDTSGLDDDKTVAVPFEKVTWSMDQNNQPRAVLTATREELAAAPEFQDDNAREAAAGGAMAPGTGTAMAPAADGTTPAAGTAPAAGMAPATTTAATTAPSGAPDANGYIAMASADQYLADDIVGEKVYSGTAENAETIGDVNDLVIGKDGQVAAAVIGVGGFLGLGEKNVAVPFGDLQMVADTDGDDVRPVLAATKDQLKSAPTFETRSTAQTAANTVNDGATAVGAAAGAGAAAVTGAASTAATATTDAANNMATAAQGTMAAGTDAATTASTNGDANDRASMTPATGADLTAERLVGTKVYGPNDRSIGDVGDIALTADGQVDAVIVDVGGFLGLGAKPVAVAMDNLQFMKDSGGSLYLYTQFTEDQLKQAPEYNRDSYAENRATMRVAPGATLPAAGTDAAAPATAPAQ